MRKLALAGIATAAAAMMMGGSVTGAAAADALTLQLKWVTQSQFSGYYVAKDKGFYEEEGLDVTILPGGPDIAPTQVIAGGGADAFVLPRPGGGDAPVIEPRPES